MDRLAIPTQPPASVQVGRRWVVPLVEAVGPALPARAAFPALVPASLASLLDEFGDDYADPSRRYLRMVSQGFAILGAGRVILVDTCLGGPKPGRPHARHGIESRWLSTMAEAGIALADVDTVVNTHLHHDHVGWNTTLVGDELRPTFPAARYLITTPEFDHVTASTPQRHITDSVLPLRAAGQLDLCDPDLLLDADVRLIPAPGHTPGHVLVEVANGGQRALLAGDLIHHPLQLRRPDISVAMCADPALSANTRLAILSEYADTDTLLVASHLPEHGYLRRHGDAFSLTA